MAKSYGRLPSEILNLSGNAWVAYQLNAAVLYLGLWAENEFEKWRDPKSGNPRKTIAQILAPRRVTLGGDDMMKQFED